MKKKKKTHKKEFTIFGWKQNCNFLSHTNFVYEERDPELKREKK